MKTKTLQIIILFLCVNLLWAGPTNSPLERGGEAVTSPSKEIIVVSKDSLHPIAKDTSKTKPSLTKRSRIESKHLAHLQQMAMARMGIAGKKSVFPIPTVPERSRRLNSSVANTEEEKTFRSFPSLD